jgi:hypothetical protein
VELKLEIATPRQTAEAFSTADFSLNPAANIILLANWRFFAINLRFRGSIVSVTDGYMMPIVGWLIT